MTKVQSYDDLLLPSTRQNDLCPKPKSIHLSRTGGCTSRSVSTVSSSRVSSANSGYGQFWTKYEAMCRQSDTAPACRVNGSSGHGRAVLDISPADRIRFDDWLPILKSLHKDNSLHYLALRAKRPNTNMIIDDKAVTEVEARQYFHRQKNKNRPALYTNFVMSSLMESIASTLRVTTNLTSLFFYNIPISGRNSHFSNLCKGVYRNRTIQHLSFQHCPIMDVGCEELSKVLHNKSNIVTLDLTDCQLTSVGANHIAELLKVHSTERYGECWKYSLRYSYIDKSDLPGLRRITLNQNHEIGDQGLSAIVNVLWDDMWVQGVDMQRCGISDVGSRLVLDLVRANRDIAVFDLRGNDLHDLTILRDIVLELDKKGSDSCTAMWLEEGVTPTASHTSLYSMPSLRAAISARSTSSATTCQTSNMRQPTSFNYRHTGRGYASSRILPMTSRTVSATSLATNRLDIPWKCDPAKKRSPYTISKRSPANFQKGHLVKSRSAEQFLTKKGNENLNDGNVELINDLITKSSKENNAADKQDYVEEVKNGTGFTSNKSNENEDDDSATIIIRRQGGGGGGDEKITSAQIKTNERVLKIIKTSTGGFIKQGTMSRTPNDGKQMDQPEKVQSKDTDENLKKNESEQEETNLSETGVNKAKQLFYQMLLEKSKKYKNDCNTSLGPGGDVSGNTKSETDHARGQCSNDRSISPLMNLKHSSRSPFPSGLKNSVSSISLLHSLPQKVQKPGSGRKLGMPPSKLQLMPQFTSGQISSRISPKPLSGGTNMTHSLPLKPSSSHVFTKGVLQSPK